MECMEQPRRSLTGNDISYIYLPSLVPKLGRVFLHVGSLHIPLLQQKKHQPFSEKKLCRKQQMFERSSLYTLLLHVDVWLIVTWHCNEANVMFCICFAVRGPSTVL